MAEKFNGLCNLVLQKNNKKALNTHCKSHRLNLIVNFLTNLNAFRNTMDAMKSISPFFDLSPKRQEHLLEIINDNFPSIKKKKLLQGGWKKLKVTLIKTLLAMLTLF